MTAVQQDHQLIEADQCEMVKQRANCRCWLDFISRGKINKELGVCCLQFTNYQK